MPAPVIKITWYSGYLEITNPTPPMLMFLRYDKRDMVFCTQRNELVSAFTHIELYEYLPDRPDTIRTGQGFVDEIVAICHKAKISYQWEDKRLALPTMDYGRARGFRCGQEAMFIKMLSCARSGLVQAPTRYGKGKIIGNTLRIFPNVKAVVAAPGVDLLNQLVNELRVMMPERDIRGIFTGSKNKLIGDDVTVCSLDSLDKVDHEGTRLLLVDEPHTAVSGARLHVLEKFTNARILGFGATLEGRFDRGDKLITKIFGPVLAQKTFREAVEEGAICNIVVHIVKIKFNPFDVSQRLAAYKKLVYENLAYDAIIKKICETVIPPEWQTLVFVDEKTQAHLMQIFVDTGVVAVAGEMTEKQRRNVYDRLVANEIKRCICTKIYSTGITFPDLRVLVNACGGGGSITGIQKPGRLAQVRPGKQAGYLIDFLFEPNIPEHEKGSHGQQRNEAWSAVERDGWARIKTYKKIGYDVRIVNDISDIKLQ